MSDLYTSSLLSDLLPLLLPSALASAALRYSLDLEAELCHRDFNGDC